MLSSTLKNWKNWIKSTDRFTNQVARFSLFFLKIWTNSHEHVFKTSVKNLNVPDVRIVFHIKQINKFTEHSTIFSYFLKK